MTVAQLIEELKKYDGDKEVYMAINRTYVDKDGIEDYTKHEEISFINNSRIRTTITEWLDIVTIG